MPKKRNKDIPGKFVLLYASGYYRTLYVNHDGSEYVVDNLGKKHPVQLDEYEVIEE